MSGQGPPRAAVAIGIVGVGILAVKVRARTFATLASLTSPSRASINFQLFMQVIRIVRFHPSVTLQTVGLVQARPAPPRRRQPRPAV